MKGGEKMNAINFLFQQHDIPTSKSSNLSKGEVDQQKGLFQATLTEEQSTNHSLTPKEIATESNQAANDEMHDRPLLNVLNEMFGNPFNGLEELLVKSEKLENLATQAESLLGQINSKEDVEQVSAELLNLLETWSTLAKSSSEQSMEDLTKLADEELVGLLEDLQARLTEEEQPLESIENLLNWLTINPLSQLGQMPLVQDLKIQLEQIVNGQGLPEKNITQLQVMLQHLLASIQKEDAPNMSMADSDATEGTETSKGRAIWQELVQTYQKRKSFESTYRMNANVGKSDVSKWLTHALNRQMTNEQVTHQGNVNLTSMPMSKVEQYVIHVNQSQGASSVDQQMIQQFEKIMQSSRFLSQPNGRMQLSIMLRPDNLGEMRIRFTQIDGEMMVRIAVNSSATKEMLEKNIHQLRNVFSPHQVVVERQEVNMQQTAELTEEQNEESLKEHEDNEQQNSDGNKQHGESNEADFQEILMNEKV